MMDTQLYSKNISVEKSNIYFLFVRKIITTICGYYLKDLYDLLGNVCSYFIF